MQIGVESQIALVDKSVFIYASFQTIRRLYERIASFELGQVTPQLAPSPNNLTKRKGDSQRDIGHTTSIKDLFRILGEILQALALRRSKFIAIESGEGPGYRRPSAQWVNRHWATHQIGCSPKMICLLIRLPLSNMTDRIILSYGRVTRMEMERLQLTLQASASNLEQLAKRPVHVAVGSCLLFGARNRVDTPDWKVTIGKGVPTGSKRRSLSSQRV
ncbi:hypothetical protein TNCV_4358511 [Trichonephila clavipes]|nr:hypothetical protein TNCV_4358511 [Trichonephila clavipes]